MPPSGGSLLPAAGRVRQGQAHVGLAQAYPHLADQDIGDRDPALAGEGHLGGFLLRVGFQGIQEHFPLSVLVGGGFLDLPGKANGDLLARSGCAPDGELHPLLQDHIVLEETSRLHVGFYCTATAPQQ